MVRCTATLLVLGTLAACQVDDLDSSAKRCPCAPGYVCETDRDRCVRDPTDAAVADASTDATLEDGGDGCVPTCGSAVCGDDGCGSTCGECGAMETCLGGRCTACPVGCETDCQQGCFDLGECVASPEGVRVQASIRTALVDVDLVGSPEDVTTHYRKQGARYWWQAADATGTTGPAHSLPIVGLDPGTAYELRVVSGASERCLSFRTQPLIEPHETVRDLYVSAGVVTSGDGTASRPYKTIQEGIDAATPGTDIHVMEGVYLESLRITEGGARGRFVRLIGEEGAVLTGADSEAFAYGRSWDAGFSTHTWSTVWSGSAPTYVGRDGLRFYRYPSQSDLERGHAHGGTPMAEGYASESGRLWVRSASDPATHQWQIPTHADGIRVEDTSWVWIEGLEIRDFGLHDSSSGIVVRGSEHVVIRNNDVHGAPELIRIRPDSWWVRVESNELHNETQLDWPVRSLGAGLDGSAIEAVGYGTVAAGNDIHHVSNGIRIGTTSPSGPRVTFGPDLHENRLASIVSTGIDALGEVAGGRVWGNVVDGSHVGLRARMAGGSLSVWGNRFTDFGSSCLLSVTNHAPLRYVHNTCHSEAPSSVAISGSVGRGAITSRNNMLVSGGRAIEVSPSGDSSADHDHLHGAGGGSEVDWDDTIHASAVQLCSSAMQECGAVTGAPALEAPGEGRYAPTTDTASVDQGVRMLGLNDEYEGAGPDMGYVELGQDEVPPLPR